MLWLVGALAALPACKDKSSPGGTSSDGAGGSMGGGNGGGAGSDGGTAGSEGGARAGGDGGSVGSVGAAGGSTGGDASGGSGGSSGASTGGSGGASAGGSGGASMGGAGGSGGTGGSSSLGGSGGATGETCGNGELEGAEQCDDENTLSGDGCSDVCEIESGWNCDDPSSCVDINECSDSTNDCHSDATCTNAEGGYECECNEGFLGDGLSCELDEGECETEPQLCSPQVASIGSGWHHNCAVLVDGAVRCWGYNVYGQLGYGHVNPIGDDERPVTDVEVGGVVTQIAPGNLHTCALLEGGAVRCWGYGAVGRLGYGNSDDIGDNEAPSTAGDVDVGGTVVQLAAGGDHTCALLEAGNIRCWGYGVYGRLGYGNTEVIGDDESPAAAGDVNVGGPVQQIVAGAYHTCALLTNGAVRCWGAGAVGHLGYGNTDLVGDNEVPASVGDVAIGGTAIALASTWEHTCALLSTGTVRCWGRANYGTLGYGNTEIIGDDETPASAGDVDVGGTVTHIAAGASHTCAVLTGGAVRCWGEGTFGRLGYGNTDFVGDNEVPATAGDVAVGAAVLQITANNDGTCALLTTGHVKCWGYNYLGGLGYGHTADVGDDETPASVGPLLLY